MCNRFRSIHRKENSARAIAEHIRLNFEFNPNVAPTDVVPIVLATLHGQPEAVMARFGITMAGREGKPRPPLLNVRTDGIRRGQFKTAIRARRCVIPALGFYEWREENGQKQPYMFCRKDGGALHLAGIWEETTYKEDTRPSFAILTDEPNTLIAAYHDRMPVALADDRVASWLDLSHAVQPEPQLMLELDAFQVRPMDRAMNSPKNKDLATFDPEAAVELAAL